MPAWRALRVVAEIGGGTAPRPGGAVRGARRRAAPAQGPVRRDRRASGGFASCRSWVPSGIGKSRLAWEFNKYMDGTRGGVWWHAGRSPAYGNGIAFWALGEMIRARWPASREIADEPTRPARGSRRRWRARARRGGAALDRAGAARPAGRGRRRRLVCATSCSPPGARSSSGSPRPAPVVMVFEDLHWADTGPLDFIDHLLDWTLERAHPMSSRWRARSCWTAGPTGAPASATSRALFLEPPRSRDARSAGTAWCPGCRSAPPARSSRVRTGCRSTPWRPSGSSLADGPPRRPTEGGYEPVGDLAEPRGARRRSTRAHRVPPGCAGPGGPLRCSRMRPSWARASRRRPGGGGGHRPVDARTRACERWCAGSPCSGGGPSLARARPVRVRAGAHPRGRLHDACQARPQGPAPRGGPLLRGAWVRRARGCPAGHYLAAYRAPAEGPRRRRWPPRPASRCGAADRASRWARRARR